jgi:hypothetical protein
MQADQDVIEIVDWLINDLWQAPRCICFEGGTVCCVDCETAKNLRREHFRKRGGQMTVPDEVLEVMAAAMLEPSMRIPGKVPEASGNKIRTRVLSRALAAAEELGWVMVPIKQESL